MPVTTFTRAGQWGPEALIDAAGDAQVGVAVALYLSDGTTLATRYAGATKAATAANPWTSDAQGNVTLFADPGQYVLKVTVGGLVTPLAIEVPVDPAEAALDADVALTNAALAAETADREAADAAHAAATSAVHGVGASTVESAAGAQAKADQALAAALAASQPLDSDLSAIAALSTTAFGRSLLALLDAAAGRTALGLGSAAVAATTDFDAAGAAAAALVTAEAFAAPIDPVATLVQAQLEGFYAVGYDAAHDTLIMQSTTSGTGLYKTSDPNLRDVSPTGPTATSLLPAGTCRQVWVVQATGTWIASVTTGGVNKLLRSTDSGVTWTVVLDPFGNANVGALRDNLAAAPNGTIIFCEYDSAPGTDTFQTWKSTDDGQTWAVLETFAAFGGHIHAVYADPYVANRFWRCWGDTDAKSKIEYSDNDGAAWTAIGSGDQTWRSVTLIFTATEIFMGTDTWTIPQSVLAWNRSTTVRRSVFSAAFQELTYSAKTLDGQYAIWSTNTNNNHTGDGEVWAFRLDGTLPAVRTFRTPGLPGASGVKSFIYGPTSTGFVFVSVYQNVAGGGLRANTYVVWLTQEHNRLEYQKVLNDLLAPSRADFLPVGTSSPSVLTTDLALTAKREFLQAFIAPATSMPPITKITIRSGSAVGGNVSVGIRSSLADGTDGPMLSTSGSVAQAGIGADQTFVLAGPGVKLVPGVKYWVSICGSSASGKIAGSTSTAGWNSGHRARYVPEGAGDAAFPPPNGQRTSQAVGYDIPTQLRP